MVAPVAKQQGEYVADLILKRERVTGSHPAFRHRTAGSWPSSGAFPPWRTFGIKMKGFFAWLAWLGLHLVFPSAFATASSPC